MESETDVKFNPWNVTDLDIYLKYCCPECDSQHDTKDFFVQHALLEHPKAGEVLEYPEENWELKDKKIESVSYFRDVKSDNLVLTLPEMKSESKQKRPSKRIREVIESDDDDYEESDIKIEPRSKRNCSLESKSPIIEVDEDDEENASDFDVSPKHEFCEPIVEKPKLNARKCDHKDYIPEGRYHCDECGKGFTHLHTLKRHFAVQHNIMCIKCEMIFPSKKLLNKHQKTCKQYQTCKTCGEKFDGAYKLKKHVKKNHPVEYTQSQCQTCELCGKVLADFHKLKLHLLRVHDVGELPPEKRKLNCSMCKKEFKSAVEMDEHFKTQCHDNDERECQNIEFNCKFCPTKWISHLSLELHIMEVHTKRMFSCDRCSYLSYKKEQIQRHIDHVHKKIRNHICHHCGKGFAFKTYLQTHLFKDHNEGPPVERNYKCDQCDKSYELPGSLKKHKTTNHDKSVSHQCPLCPKTFLHKGYLYAHVKHVHEKYCPNKCDICPEAFLTKRDLKKHKEKHGIYD